MYDLYVPGFRYLLAQYIILFLHMTPEKNEE